MFNHPYISAQIAAARQRDWLSDAARNRLAAQFRGRPQAARRTSGPGRSMIRVLRRAATFRTPMPA